MRQRCGHRADGRAPPRTGVTYVADPAEPYDGTRTSTVTVTATLEDGFGWGTVDEPWMRVDDVTATLTVTLVGTSCDERVPAAPTVTQAVCAGASSTADAGVGRTPTASPTPWLLTVRIAGAVGDGDGDVGRRPGSAGRPSYPTGGHETSETTATYQVVFDAVTCTPVAPVAPTVTQATCANGAVMRRRSCCRPRPA